MYDLFEVIAGSMQSFRFALGGDINAGRIWDTKQDAPPEKQHTPFFEWAQRVGFHDAHWILHKKEVPTYPASAPIVQNDHLFVTSGLAQSVCRCEVVRFDEASTLSDHLPMVLEFDMLST